jgi:sugar phosphate isomerase/epimerase
VLNHFTLARQHPLIDRVAAAAAAGFAGIGLYLGEYLRLCSEGFDIEQLADLLDEHELCLADIEVVRVWPDNDDAVEAMARFEAAAWQLADRFDCRYLQAIGPTVGGTLAEAAPAFAALCDRAADHGLLVGLEFLPFTDIVSAADALRIVEAADRANGGVCVDIWHHRRGADDLSLVTAIPPERVMAVQMNDGPMRPDLDSYYEDCLRRRVPPGQGEMDAVGFVVTLLEMGVRLPWSIEVCNDAVWDQPAAPHVQACADGMRAVLAEARTRVAY